MVIPNRKPRSHSPAAARRASRVFRWVGSRLLSIGGSPMDIGQLAIMLICTILGIWYVGASIYNRRRGLTLARWRDRPRQTAQATRCGPAAGDTRAAAVVVIPARDRSPRSADP